MRKAGNTRSGHPHVHLNGAAGSQAGWCVSWAACTLPEAGAWDGALHSPFGNSDLETLVMLNPKLFLVINCVLSVFYFFKDFIYFIYLFLERGERK